MQLVRKYRLEQQGIKNIGDVHWNLTVASLYEEIARRREGTIAHLGPIVVRTGHHTGRSPNDKFIEEEPTSKDKIWWGKVNRSISSQHFDKLHMRFLSFLQGKDIFVQDCFAGADPRYRLPIRVVTTTAWHSLFARVMFLIATPEEQLNHVPQFTVIDAPGFHAEPEVDGTNSEVFIVLSFEKRIVLIGGTSYAGEIKKSIFTIMNYLLPQKDRVFPMHCSANVGANGDVAIFFGLSGTGKTTLSADPERKLIGDDEHGWSDNGVFNFEGGCYAKVINLSKESEPEIYACTEKFGTVLENVAINSDTRRIDLNDATLTENTRAAYPILHLPNIIWPGIAPHPKNVIMLTCDAFGVLPPIAKLTPEQAMYHFLSGYTAKVAGTEKGLGNEPKSTFSTCFGAPFMALHPSVYADLLQERISKHKVDCWLVNTGWSGGPFGVGERMKISYTRALIRAALSGKLKDIPVTPDPIFGVLVPQSCPGVPTEILTPINTWKNKDDYKKMAQTLAKQFQENFKQFEDKVSADVKAVGPKVE